MDHVHPTPINKRSVSMQIWVTTMQNAIRFDGNKHRYGSKGWVYGSLRRKKRSVSMETSTDTDPKDGFVDHYIAKSDPFRWKQAQIWIQRMGLWIATMQLRCKKRSVSMETSTDTDPKDGFVDHYIAKSDPFRWKQAQIWIQRMGLWITTTQKAICFDG
eukprot:212271_1